MLGSGRLGTVGKRRSEKSSWRTAAPAMSTTLFEFSITSAGTSAFSSMSAMKRGRLLDNAVERAQPRRLLELGTYCGYSAPRMAGVMPRGARLYSVEFNTATAESLAASWPTPAWKTG